MKAIHLIKYGNSDKAFEIREIQKPQPHEGEILIKVDTFGLNFADVVARRGLYPEAPKNPAVLGYDVAGQVVEIGKGVKNLKIGQRVVSMTRFGGYAEYAKVSALGVAVLDDSIDYPTSTALATQACTAYYCAYESTRLHEGDKVLIHAAAGGVGSILVQMCKLHNCIVYGTASSSKIDYLKSIGVDYPIDYSSLDFSKQISKASLDVVFDSIGGSTFNKSFKLLRPTGKMVFFGAADQMNGSKTNFLDALKVGVGFGFFSPIPLLMNSRALIGVNMLKVADYKPQMIAHCLNQVIQLVKNQKIKPKLDKVFSYNQIAEAHDYLESRKSIGKIAVRWE
jgi:NADPH:quinone reductase-like Zn-dependent oxidoreductase